MTPAVDISVVMPTRNRPQKLARLIDELGSQTTAHSFEIVVVDDGSTPPVEITPNGARFNLIRLEGVERSAARNAGAARACGRLLVFVDDDLRIGADFLERHWQGFEEWPSALFVGLQCLPPEIDATPFGRFRLRLEAHEMPTLRGPVTRRNFATAANLSVSRKWFLRLGGFDPRMTSAEDQDLALRHTARGGRIVFLPEAVGIHDDDALDFHSYGARAEWGAAALGPFIDRHPDWPDNVERMRVNGPVRLFGEPVSLTIRKIAKRTFETPLAFALLVSLVEGVEKAAPRGRLIQRLYEIVLGVQLRRGHRRIVARSPERDGEESPTLRRAS
jgi:GT2 family glycosyltransferase